MADIIITRFDHDRLTSLLGRKKPHDANDRMLLAELDKAKIVEPADVPPDVVTMNSQVHFSDDYGDGWDYWLVFPEDANLAESKISVLSPVGSSLLGYRIGDEIEINTPHGHRQLKVEEIIHQPEREGDFNS